MEKFSPNIVVNRCQQAGINFWLASRVALDIKDSLDRQWDDSRLNHHITGALKAYDQEAANQFETYHSINVRTSKNTLEPFSRDKIMKSIVLETRLPKIAADEIAQEVEDDVRRLQLKNVSAPLIREMVNAKLLEKRLIDYKANYTRVGLPIYDIKNIIKQQIPHPRLLTERFGSTMMGEYTLTKVLPSAISNAYLSGDIHIHGLETFITSPLSFQNDLRAFLEHGVRLEGIVETKPAKNPEVVLSHAARVLQASYKNVGGGVSFDFFNIFVAPYLHRRSQRTVEQVAQTFLYELNQVHAQDHAFTVNFDLGVPGFLRDVEAIGPGGAVKGTYGDYADEAELFLRSFIKMLSTGDSHGKRFPWPEVCIKKRGSGKIGEIPRNCFLINQGAAKNSNLVFGNVIYNRPWEETLRCGIMQSVSINLPSIAASAKDDNELFDEIEKRLETARDAMTIKKKVIEKRVSEQNMLRFLTQKFNGKQYIYPDRFAYVVSYFGLPELCSLYLEKSVYDKECLKFSRRIARLSRKTFKSYSDSGVLFSLGESRDAEVVTRLNKINETRGLEKCSGRVFPGKSEVSAKDIAKQLQPLFDGGVFLDVDDPRTLKDRDILFLRFAE